MDFPMPRAPDEWPASNLDFDFYYEGLRNRQLLIQRCASCASVRFPPAPMCGVCGSIDWLELKCGGVGQIYSFTVQHRPAVPPFASPHAMALVEFPEGFRSALSYAGPDPETGAPVKVVFVEGKNGVVLPVAVGSN